VNCLEVRDLLAERTLHGVAGDVEAAVVRHLAWCAGCRKEDVALRSAAASVALSLPQVEPPTDLEDRVVATVKAATPAAGRRRGRAAAVSLLAAAVAVGGLGWGSLMAGRAERAEERADRALHQQAVAIERFDELISGLGLVTTPADETRRGRLVPADGVGGGAALVLLSRDVMDFAVVIVKGLDPERAPYRVALVTDRGVELGAGKLRELDAEGGGEVVREFDRNLRPFDHVVVRDAGGEVVLEGDVAPRVGAGPGGGLGLR
jgi:hypothetical protein